jgi:large subunit ribosomal protein L12e
MAGKKDAPVEESKFIYMKVVGGEPVAAAALAPKCGPLGMPPKKVGDDITAATKDWKAIKVPVEVEVCNRQISVKVLPSASSLIQKALKQPPRVRPRDKETVYTFEGNLDFETIVDISEQMEHKSMSRTFAGTVKQILGTCNSLGITVDGFTGKEAQKKVNEGHWTLPK